MAETVHLRVQEHLGVVVGGQLISAYRVWARDPEVVVDGYFLGQVAVRQEL